MATLPFIPAVLCFKSRAGFLSLALAPPMNSHTDDEPDLESIHELFASEETALAEARSRVTWHEHRLKELTKAHPAAAALHQPALELTLSAFRKDELDAILKRINPTLKLTGEEEDYWLQLWDFAGTNGPGSGVLARRPFTTGSVN